MGKMAITVNGDKPGNLFPAFIMGSSAVASGDELILFFGPNAAPALKKGVLEGMTAKGLPDMAELVEGVEVLGGRIMLCELAFEAKDMTEDELRDDVEIVGATTFIVAAQGADLTFSF